MQQLKYGELPGSSDSDDGGASPKLINRNKATTKQFEEAFRNIIQTNDCSEALAGIELLISLTSRLLDVQSAGKVYGVDRAS